MGPPPLIRTLTGRDLDLDVFLALHRGAVTCPIARSLIQNLHETLLNFRHSSAEIDAINEKEFLRLEARIDELITDKQNLLLKLEGGLPQA